jgi:hypothetical protein
MIEDKDAEIDRKKEHLKILEEKSKRIEIKVHAMEKYKS